MEKNKQKRTIESYPTRQMRLEDTTWEKFKATKLKSGKTWQKFILELLKKLG